MLAGCGGGDCAKKEQGQERDTCYYEATFDRLHDGDSDGAFTSLEGIESPMLRAAAIRQLASETPSEADIKRLREACDALPERHGEACGRTLQRPHLWGD